MNLMSSLKTAFAEEDHDKAMSVLAQASFDREVLANLSASFMFLSLVFRYPDEPIYQILKTYVPAFSEFAEEYTGSALEVTDGREMEYDYVRLFINAPGGMRANPYVSCWLSEKKLLWGEKMIRLKELMAAEGFAVNRNAADLEDHVSVVLEFCSVLIEKVSSESMEDKVGSCFVLLEIMRDFFPVFGGVFASKVEEGAELDFYKTAAKLLRGFLADAESIFEELIFEGK